MHVGSQVFMIAYDNFAVKLEPRQGEVYPVIVLDSPAGQGRGQFKLPLWPETLGPLLVDLGRAVRGSGSAQSAPTTARKEEQAGWRSPHQIGDQLFRALFSGRVRTLYDRSLGHIEGQPNRGLRLMLHLDPEHPDLAQLASLPWELLYQNETRDFLSLNHLTPIVRYLDVPRPTRPQPFQPPLRILVVVSSPTGVDPLDLAQERRLIEEAWGQDESVEVRFLEQATTAALRRAMLREPFHVLHYMGHGDFDEPTGRGVLLFEDAQGNPDPISGQALATLLQGVGALRLVFLNACDTARTSRREGVDPFAGVATALVMGGLPAVVAMQFPISDRAAIAFSQEFYHRLAAGDPVDAAVAEGRVATYLADPESLEWVTPVLFMRIPDGRLFDIADPELATRSPGEIRKMEEVAQGEPTRDREAPRQEKPRPHVAVPWRLAASVLALVVVAAVVFAYLNFDDAPLSPAGLVAPPSPTLAITEATEGGPAVPLTSPAIIPQPTATSLPASSDAITAQNADRMAELARLGRGTLNQMTISPDGQTLAVASSLGVWLYDVESLKSLKLMAEGTGQVHDVAWSPDGSALATAHADSTVRLWDVAGGEGRRTLKGHTGAVWAVAWSADGSRLASGSGDQTVRIWTAVDGQELRVLTGHTGRVQSVTWPPDGTRLASGGLDHTVRVWDADTGREIHLLTSHENLVRQVAWSPDGMRLASGASPDGTVRVWDADSGQEVWRLRGDGIAWSPDGQRLAVGSGEGLVRVWDVAGEREWLALEGHTDRVGLVAWSPDGARLASGSRDNTVRVWNLTDQADKRGSGVLAIHVGTVSSVAWSPDGSQVAAGSEDGTVWIWDAAGSQERRLQEGSAPVQSIAWAAEGRELRAGSADTVQVWNVVRGEVLRRLERTGAMAWSPDGSQFVARGEDGTVRIWALAGGTGLQVLSGHTDFVWQAVWSPDGTWLATASSDNTVRVWEVTRGEAVGVFEDRAAYLDDPEGGDVFSVAWSPDGSRLASGARDGTVRVWNVAGGEVLKVLEARTPVQSLAWSPHGSLLALGGYDGSVQVWDVDSGTELHTLAGHTDAVLSVAWAPDGTQLASGSGDGTVRVWGIPNAVSTNAAGHITYQLSDGEVYRIAAHAEATPENVSLALDRLAAGSEDADLNISPDGEWLILNTDRFDAGCAGWPCLAIVAGDLSSGEAIRAEGDLIHPVGIGAVASGGNLIVYPADAGPHTRDLWAVVRSGNIWSKPLLLTGQSPYDWHERPAITADGQKVVFNCGPTYGGAGTAICEVGTDGTAFRVVVAPEEGPEGSKQNSLHHPDYEPDGSIVFEADWRGSQQIWRLPAGSVEPIRIVRRNEAENDGTPCVLPDGRIASLWSWPPQIKVMTSKGHSSFSLSPSPEILGVGLGCGK